MPSGLETFGIRIVVEACAEGAAPFTDANPREDRATPQHAAATGASCRRR
ncbi:hypothetical protein GCM10023068_19090 [Leifsonia shinshuensis]